MKVFTCLLLIRIFAYTLSIQLLNKPAENRRSVNLALETVLEFNNKDNSGDVKFLDNIQKFISKVKTVIDRKKNLRRDFRAPKIESFKDFLQEVVSILNNYEDDAFNDFFVILDEEIRKYHYRGCKFYELTENYEIRKLFASKLDMVKGQPTFIIRTYINVISDMIRDENYDKNVKELVDYINSLYRHDAREKFRKVLNELDIYGQTKSKKSEASLVKIVRDGIRSIIFDHYTDLNPNARRELKYKIEAFWKQYKQSSATRSKPVDNNNFQTDVRPDFKDESGKNILAMPSTYKKEDYKNHDKKNSDSKRIEIKMSDYKKNGNMRDGVKEEKKPKLNKYTKIDIVDDVTTNTEVTLAISKKDSPSYQSTTSEDNQRQARTYSSDEGDFTGESFEGNSIEFFQEQQREANTQRYMTLYPEEITYEPKTTEATTTSTSSTSPTTTADAKSIVHRSVQLLTFKPNFQTLWVEESTGAIPKYILNKYTTKPSHKHKTTHEQKYEKKYELRNELKYDTKHDKKHDNKHDNKHDSKHDYKHDIKHDTKHDYKHDSKYDTKHELKYDSKHGPKHQSKHGPKYKLKHKSKHGSKHKSKHGQKKKHHKKKLRENVEENVHTPHHPKHGKPLISKLLPKHKKAELFSQDHGFIDVATAMEFYEYKKMMEPAGTTRFETTTELTSRKPSITMKPVKPTKFLAAAKLYTTSAENLLLPRKRSSTNRPDPPSKIYLKSFRPTIQTYLSTEPTRGSNQKIAPVEQFAKRYELLVGKQHRDFRKSVAPPIYNERYSLEQFKKERTQKKYFRKSYNNSYTKTTTALNSNVIKRLKNLEIALSEVQNKINEVTNIAKLEQEVTKHIDIKDRFIDAKRMYKMFNTKVKNDVNLIPNDLKMRRNRFKLTGASDKEIEPRHRFKLTGASDREIGPKNEPKYLKQKETKLIEPIFITPIVRLYDEVANETTRLTNRQEIKTIQNNTRNTETSKPIYVTITYDKNHIEPGAKNDLKVKLVDANQKQNNEIRANQINNYDDADIWKNTYNHNMKTDTKTTTVSPGKYTGTATTARSETTTQPNITAKSTDMVTSPQKASFVTVSPNKIFLTISPNVVKKNEVLQVNTNSDNKSKLSINQSHLDSNFNESNKSSTAKQNIVKEISRINNATKLILSSSIIPTVTKPSTQTPTTNWRFRELAFSSPPHHFGMDNFTQPNDMFTDPFDSIDVGMDFLKTIK